MDDRMDEGYADESRSQEGDVEMPSTFSVVKEMEQAAVGLTEADREELVYCLMQDLPAHTLTSLFDRMWPAFHKDPLQYLPAEIISLVLAYLAPQDLLRAMSVSRAWRVRAMDSRLWRTKYEAEGWLLDAASIDRHDRYNADRARRYQTARRASSRDKHTDSSISDGESMIAHVSTEGRDKVSKTDPTTMLDSLHFGNDHALDYQNIYRQKRRLEANWDKGRYRNFQLPHPDHPEDAHEECVYTLQYRGNHLVSGSRDRTLRIWDIDRGRLVRKPLRGHLGSVLCLQFDESLDEDLIISGSSDACIILWRFSTGKMLKRISQAHHESVLNLRFDHRYLVTCSKDKTIKLWNRRLLHPGDADLPQPSHGESPLFVIDTSVPLEPYSHLMTLGQHAAAVNAIQIYGDQLVSASGDRNLRMWDIQTGECLSRVQAHEKGIACVQYDGSQIISGSSDNSIRIWDSATHQELARLEGHTRLVRTLQASFYGSSWSRIVSGSYDEQVLIWKKDKHDDWAVSHRLGQADALGAVGPIIPNQSAFVPPTERPHLRSISEGFPQNEHSQEQHDPRTPHRQNDHNAISHGQHSQIESPDRFGLISTPSLSAEFGSARPRRRDLASPDPAYRRSSLQHHANQPSAMFLHDELSSRDLESTQPVRSLEGVGAVPETTPPRIPTRRRALETDHLSTASNARHETDTHIALAAARAGASLDVASEATTPVPEIGRTDLASTAAAAAAHAAARAAAATTTTSQPNARVFKLQFDARRIICCSQDCKIVGWDFANDDADILACCPFFADPA